MTDVSGFRLEVLWTPQLHHSSACICSVSARTTSTILDIMGSVSTDAAFAYKKSPKGRYFRELKVCLFTKGTNMQTLLNSIKPWHNCTQYQKITFHVVLDFADGPQAALPDFVNVVSVPASFQPAHAKYKERALECCRLHWKLSELDWVPHLDEETEIDDYLVKACFDFIERVTEDIGMRIADDFGRFQLPVRLLKRPLLGWMNGSFILIDGSVENKVTWDTGCLAEDFWFALHVCDLNYINKGVLQTFEQAARQGFKFGWIHAIA
ncbi:hypothetical protein PENFLA_c071G01624 [Penicillium flavigenum]|uniref:Uncharacterized protein n=1 Tax=Penicillium flavigenum TaxID=254877 RepID=A0A1V6SE49_9EURO|nr:hypothetical protein PENFLA_c071G01624 [Penicillium flavigenum]